MPRPWEEGYKPPSAREAFDPSQPLPEQTLETLAWIDGKDQRIADLEETLRATFRFAATLHRDLHGPVTSREWSDLRSRVSRALGS